jgi:thioredoxin reductase (NADPH)
MKGTQFLLVAIAGGLGSFEPRKPLIDGINFYEIRN